MSHFLDWKEHFPWTWFWLQFHTIPPIPSPPNHIWQRKLAAYKCILWEIRSFCPHFPIFAIPFIFYLLSNLFFFKLSPLLVFSYPHNCLLIFLLLSPLLPLPRLLALHDQCKSLIKTLRSQRISWGFVFDSVCVYLCVCVCKTEHVACKVTQSCGLQILLLTHTHSAPWPALTLRAQIVHVHVCERSVFLRTQTTKTDTFWLKLDFNSLILCPFVRTGQLMFYIFLIVNK